VAKKSRSFLLSRAMTAQSAAAIAIATAARHVTNPLSHSRNEKVSSKHSTSGVFTFYTDML
jgi:hypothetical protein